MVALSALWLPIVVSAVFVFFASFVIWTISPLHKSDMKGVPDEGAFLEAVRKQSLAPGMYMFPFCKDMKEMGQPEMIKKFEQGPVGRMIIRSSGKPSLGRPMVFSFIYNLIVALFVAYLAGRTLASGTPYLAVFRVVGTATILAYAGGIFYSAIWFGRPWSVVWKEVFDGVVYGLLTAGVFGWLWPR